MKKYLLPLCIFFGSHLSFGQSIDLTFGNNGTVTQLGKGSFFEPTLLSDGKIILSWSYETNISKKAIIVKLNEDGSLDTTFAVGGVFTMDLQASPDYYESFSKVLVQNDGKLFFAYGQDFDNGIDPESLTLNLMRLNTNGTLDVTFTNPWSMTTTNLDNAPYEFKLLSSGKYLTYGPNYMMRFNADGSLDSTYGTNGTRTITFNINELFVSGDNIYIDGNPTNNYNDRTLYKLLNESAGISNSNNFVTGSIFQDNAFFYIDQNNFSTHELTKLDSNLSLVTGFGTNGKASLSTQTYAQKLLFQPGGSIIIYSNVNNVSLGESYHNYTRLNFNGSLNTSFGQGGTFTITNLASANLQPYAENLMHSNGKIYCVFYENSSTNNIFLKRITLPNELLSVVDGNVPEKVIVIENPVQNMLKLSSDLYSMNIFDMSGKVIMKNLNGKIISVEHLSSGVYNIIGLNNKGNVVKLRFIKK